MIKLNQDTKDHPTESLIYTNLLKVNLSTSPPVLVPCERKVYKEVPDSFEIPILKPETLIPPERKEWETISDTLGYDFNGDSVSDYKTSYLNSDVEFCSNFKKSNENILDTSIISELSLSDESFQNHYENTFDWSESDCSLTQLLSEPESVPCVTTGKEERDQIDGVEFISFETESDLIEYTKVELDFKGVAAASQSDDGLEMLDDGSFSDINSSHTIIPTKTNDITKIKGWKNKRFALTLNSDDDSRTSQKSDDGYDDGFESSYMRNAEEASSEDRESTKMSDKLELLDPTDGASNTVETKSDLNDETSNSVTQNVTLNLTELNKSDIKSDPLSSENLLNWKKCSSTSTKIESKFVKLTENNLLATSTVNGTNLLYKRRVSQSLIDSISNKIKYNFGDEEQSPPERPFSETLSTESDICPRKKPMFDKPVMADNSIFPKEIEETPNNSKSAFVSDVLENFLKSHSKLNIHYELANLKAAENITHSEEDLMINPPVVITRPRITKNPVMWNGPKPKTLAEKRRMIEDGILQAENKNLMGESSKSEASTSTVNSVVSKRKRLNEDMVKLNNEFKEVVNSLDQDSVQTTKSNKTDIKEEKSVYDKKRFRLSVRKRSGIEDIRGPTSNSLEQNKKTEKKNIEIKPKNKFNGKKKFKKPSFGSHGEIQNCCPVNLKRRIPNNLNMSIKSCAGEQKICQEFIFSPLNLKDKVGMILHVGLGRPLYEEAAHNLELLKGDKKEISEGFASFAASAVVYNRNINSAYKGTKILVPVVCKKLIDLISKSKPKLKPNLRVKNNITISKVNTSLKKNIIPSKNQQKISPTKYIMESTNDIRHLMNDMLQYVSNKDLFTDQKYNFDPDVPITEDINKKTCKSHERNVLKTSKQKDKSKLNRQLKKIGVTFIDITEETKRDESSEDSPNENEICSKEFCKYGCICDSLKVKDRKIDHCRRVICMFKCKCNKSMLIKGMLGKGIVEIKSRLWLSANVMQIQHERELNLAKEEREYHQTVIRSNDKVILMSTGRKREIKLPLKYRDSEVFLGKDFSIEPMGKEINFTTNTDTSNTKTNKKISLDEQKKKGINKAPIDALEKRTFWESFYDISPCSVVLDKVDISKKNSMLCKSPIMKSKNRRRRRNVAVKRTAAITMNNYIKRPSSNKVTTTATDDAIVFVNDSSEEEDQSKQVLGKIDNVFSLKYQNFSENFSANKELLYEQSEEPVISYNVNKTVNKDKQTLVRMNESTALLPKILAPSRFLVVELVDHLFTALKFKKYGLTISYINLKQALRKAELSNKTIRIIFPLNNKKARSKYAAYAVPGLGDKMIFFGPYGLKEKHGLYGMKMKGKKFVKIPFIKKDAHERKESGIRYLWWEKKFHEYVTKPTTKKITNVCSEPTASDSKNGSVKQQKVKQKTKKKKYKKIKPKKKAVNTIADQLSKTSITDLPPSENESVADQPLSEILSKNDQPQSEKSGKNNQIPLIRVRSDLMAVNPPKEEQPKESISETVEKSRENETTTELDNQVPYKYFRQRKKRKIDSEKTNKKHEKESSLIETVATDSQESGTFDEISDFNVNEESDGDLDVFLYQPIGAVLTDYRKMNEIVMKKRVSKYDMDERLYKDPLELDSDDPLPEAALLCLTPGIGYLPIVKNNNSKIIIKNPVDNKKHTFPGIHEASIFLNKSFKKKMTFDPKDVELKWLLVKLPIIKRLRPFDPDILNNSSLIVTQDGVVEEHTHAINTERNLRERKRRKLLFNLARQLGKLFLTDDQLRKVSLKGILDAAVSIIRKVIEISVNFVSILNHEESKKKRLQSRLKILRVEHCLKIYRLRVEASKEKNKYKQSGSKQVINSTENIQTTDNPRIVTLDNDNEDVVAVCSSPDSVRVLTPVNQRPRRRQRPKEIIEITVSSDDEALEDKCIEISDSDSVEITCISNQDSLARTTPTIPETSFTGYITPPNSSPSLTKSPILKPVTSILSPNLKQIETDINAKMIPLTIHSVNHLSAEQPKPSWYIVPEEPPSVAIPTFDPLAVTVSTVPVNRFQLARKTVLVRQNEHGGVELTRPPQKIQPKILSPEARFSPLTRPQSLLYKMPNPGKIILNKSPTSTVVGTISVDRLTNKPLIVSTEPVVPTTSTLFQTTVKDCSKPKRVLLSSSSSLLKNSLTQGKQPISLSSQNLQHSNTFIRMEQPFRVSPSSKSETSENSSSEDNDFSDLSPDKSVIPLKTNLLNKDHLYSNVSTDLIAQKTKSPSSSPGGETSSDAMTDSSNTEKTVTKKKDHQIDSNVLKGPKLRYPKQHNSSSKGVKVLHPVEKR